MPRMDWEEIAEETIKKAEHVDCSLAEFARGLRDIEIAIRERRELADAEVRDTEP